MKKYFAFVVAIVLIFAVTIPAFADTTAFAEIKFDISPFEDSDKYTIEFDDMDDTGIITLNEGGYITAIFDNDDGIILGQFDIKITESLPPILRLSFLYAGEDWIFTDNVIIKTANARYSFEVNRDTDVSGGKIYESFTIAFTDESIQMLQDIVDSDDHLVKLRLDGSNRDVDGQIIFTPEQIKAFLDDYRASGALDNDFSLLKELRPCKIKQS